MGEFRRGRLAGSKGAPVEGETSQLVAVMDGVRIEQILSGALEAPVDYRQDHDEWVAVLVGGAALEIGGEAVSLAPGEWLLLPRGMPHRLVSVVPGTSWLAVRVPSLPPPQVPLPTGGP